MSLDLSSADGLSSHLPAPAAFDSRVEEAFAEKWGSEPRDGWRLVRVCAAELQVKEPRRVA